MGETENITESKTDAAFRTGQLDVLRKSQMFFAGLRESVRPGFVSDTHKQFVTTLLKQAQEVQLYDPEIS